MVVENGVVTGSRRNNASKNRPAYGMKRPGLISTVGRSAVTMRFIFRHTGKIRERPPPVGFAKDGIVETDIYHEGVHVYASIRAMAFDSRGNILIAGVANTSSDRSYPSNILLAKYTPNGILVKSFGDNGIVITVIGADKDANAHSVVLDKSDNIFIGGYALGSRNDDFLIAKYTPNGVLDTAFGGGGTGWVGTDIYYWDYARAIAIDSQNRIILAGGIGTGTSDGAVVRHTSAGIRDIRFGNGGKVNFGWELKTSLPAETGEVCKGVVTDSNNKIIVCGYLIASSTGLKETFVVRLNEDGTLDSTWNRRGPYPGVITRTTAGNNYSNALLLDTNGDIIVGGDGFNVQPASSDRYLYVMKLHGGEGSDAGTLDSTFGKNGIVETNITGVTQTSMAQDGNGNIIVAGFIKPGLIPGDQQDFFMVKYTPSGELDTSFGEE